MTKKQTAELRLVQERVLVALGDASEEDLVQAQLDCGLEYLYGRYELDPDDPAHTDSAKRIIRCAAFWAWWRQVWAIAERRFLASNRLPLGLADLALYKAYMTHELDDFFPPPSVHNQYGYDH